MFKSLYINEYELTNKQETIEIIIYSVVSFFLPFIIGHPQYLVGALVNSLLIISAMNIKGYKLLPIIIAPSLGALTQGLLFGPFTIFLVYMAPFIWIGNAVLVYCFKYFKLTKKMNYWLTLLIGSITKAVFLFIIAYILYSLNIIPVIFLTAMGIIQLVTAISGGVIAYIFNFLKNKVIPSLS